MQNILLILFIRARYLIKLVCLGYSSLLKNIEGQLFMTISFANFSISRSLADNEALTQQSWSDLIARANKAKVPYFSAVVCQMKGGPDQVYDAIHFDRYLKHNEIKDPLTRLEIEKVEYQFLKTPIDLKKRKHTFSSLPLPDTFQQKNIAFEANNFHACENSEQLSRAADCQLIFGSFLLKNAKLPKEYREACRWLACAASNGNTLAQAILQVRQEYLRSTRHLRHLKESPSIPRQCRVI